MKGLNEYSSQTSNVCTVITDHRGGGKIMKTDFEQTPDCLALIARGHGLRAAYPAYGIMLAFKRTFIESSAELCL